MIAWQPAGALAARHRFRDLAAPESDNAGRLAHLAQLLHRRLTLLTQMYRALNSPGRLLGTGKSEQVDGALKRIGYQTDRARQIVQRIREFVGKGEARMRAERLPE